MTRNFIGLATIVLLLVLIAGLAVAVKGGMFGWFIMAGAILGIVATYRADARLVNEDRVRTLVENAARFDELSTLAVRTNREVVVSGGSRWLMLASLVIAGAALLWWGFAFKPLLLIPVGVLFLVSGGVGLAEAIATAGQPAISISAQGFKVAQSPLIRWDLLYGIALQRLNPRTSAGAPTYFLQFRVDALPELVPGFSPMYRLFYRLRPRTRRNRITVQFHKAEEDPEVIYRLARKCWDESTGRNYDWNPEKSDEYNQALKEKWEIEEVLKGKLKLEELIAANPASLADMAERPARIDKIFVEDAKRTARKLNWLAISGLIAFLVYLAATVRKYFL